MNFVIDGPKGIEIVYGSKNTCIHSSGTDGGEEIAQVNTAKTMETSTSSESSYHTPRTSSDGTPRFSHLPECIDSTDSGSSDANHNKMNGAGVTINNGGKPKEESKTPCEEEDDPKEMSRRLVEYFVVVSSVPKRRNSKEAESKGSSKQLNSGVSLDSSHRSHQSSPIAARLNARKSHAEGERRDNGNNAAWSAPKVGTAVDAAEQDADEQKGQSTTNEFRILSPPTPIELPTTANAGVSLLGESMSPSERKSIASLQQTDKMLGESLFGGESELADERITATSSNTPSTAQTLKKNFFKSMNKHKKKIQAETAKIQAETAKMTATVQANTSKINATSLKNLETTVRGLDKTFKTMNLTPKQREAGTIKFDHQSSSSDSSFSRDDGTPNTDASTFQPSRNATSAHRKGAVPLTPTQPPPPTILLGGSNRIRGASENIRISPLPDRYSMPKGPSDNIRMGHENNMHVDNEGLSDDIDDFMLEPVVTAQYPPADHSDQPLNPMINQFCHPHGIDAIVPLHEFKMPTVHHFVLTDSTGGKLYGTCLTVYEEFSPQSDIEIRSGEEDDKHLSSSRDECQERGFVECSVDIPGRSRRQPSTHKKYYAPRVLCLLSTWPYLSAFRTYLTQLYRMATTTSIMTAPLERYIENICAEVPAPPPGTFEVKLSILGTTIRFWAPPADQPIPYVSLPYGVLFECLDIGNVMFAWFTLACEQKLLLVSSQLSLLAVCGEILCSMLFPMKWSHLYIPCLPKFLTPMLDAPLPYLCGISREIFHLAVADISEETVVIDLDRNVITMGRLSPEVPFIPHKRKLKLEETLEHHAGDVFWKARGTTSSEVEEARLCGDENILAKILGTADAVWDEKICGMDDAFNLAHGPASMSLLHSDEGVDQKQSRWDAVQEGFLRFYVSMLKDYRKFMPSVPTNEQSTWRGPGSADGGRFLSKEFVESQPLDYQPLLEELTGTQMFDDFVTRRMYNAGDAPDIKFFDQSIDAKRNRSKLKLKKKETPFLHNAIARRQLKQIDAIQPNQENVPRRSRFDSRFDFKKGLYTYPIWPETLDESLYAKPRPIPRIITAEFDRRSALAAMLRAKHGHPKGGRLPGSDNPSPEATAFVLFFVTFSNTIGKDWALLEKESAIIRENLLDEFPDGVSSDSPMPEGPWKPKVNPPWMEESFHSLHTAFRPSPKKPDPPEDIVYDHDTNGFCAPDCSNICDVRKAIDSSTFVGAPWARNDSTLVEIPDMRYVKSPSEEEREDEIEKARSIAKAQIDLGFNTLKMMRLRKLPNESITYKTLIEACGRCGIAHRLHQLMEMMTQDGMKPDSEVYFSFIEAISNSENNDAIVLKSKGTRATDTSSEFSANVTTKSAASSNFSFLNLSHGEEQPGKLSTKTNGNRVMDGFQHAMQSSIESNRRAFKIAKSKRLKKLTTRNLTPKKKLHVTTAIKTHLELGLCILGDLYPGIFIDKSDTCPKCSRVLGQDNIIMGWKPCQVEDFSTKCPSCKFRFVPKFSVSCDLESFEGSQGKGTPLYCNYLSPWVLLQEIRSLLKTSVGGKAAKILGVESNDVERIGIDGIINPEFREGTGINATLWWNMIVTFARFKIPLTFLLQGSYKDQQLIMPTLEDT